MRRILDVRRGIACQANGGSLRRTRDLLFICLAAALSGAALAHERSADPDVDGSIFIRLSIQKRELYVGESVPVAIQVGAPDDVVASLDSPPSLKGDAFTLNVLSGEPDREQRVIDGRPCTLLVWHSLLAAVKPGDLSLTIEAPMTVRLPDPDAHEGVFADEAAADPYDDAPVQSLMQTTVPHAFLASSEPMEFHVLPLPMENRPAGFSGAIGTFTISTELSRSRTTVGEPLTLRMRVLGAGNFDRVNSVMLASVKDWKVYRPTATFKSTEETGYRGEKIFEQAVVATAPGTHELPALEFSYFDPGTRHYAIARAAPQPVEVDANAEAHMLPATMAPADSLRGVPRAVSPTAGALERADHAASSATARSLVPPYLQPRFLGISAGLMLAFTGAWLKRRNRDRVILSLRDRESRDRALEDLLLKMQRAAATGDAAAFFRCARRALSGCSSGLDAEVRDVLILADETEYAGASPAAAELNRCNRVITRFLASLPARRAAPQA